MALFINQICTQIASINTVLPRNLLMGIKGLFFAVGILAASSSGAYPIDAFSETGIQRLRVYVDPASPYRKTREAGALLKPADIQLRLKDRPDLTWKNDEALKQQILEILGDKADLYAVSILDLTNPDQPRYIGHRDDQPSNPGSVGKLMVGASVFNQLAARFPDDIAARKKLLNDYMIPSDEFTIHNVHDVPLWNEDTKNLIIRPLRAGDTGNFYSYLDWMYSASSNGAAAMIMKNLVYMRAFPQTFDTAAPPIDAWYKETKKITLQNLLLDVMREPLANAGINTNNLRQGSIFTQTGKNKVPGTSSYMTTSEMIRFLVKLEQGKLVDEFSSLEMKKLMYMTQKRIRYASSPSLVKSAVYFKSGSLYRCQKEEGFTCRKYQGNLENRMNSVAIVESPAGQPKYYYLVALTSNVLKVNSAVEHQTIATRIHKMITSLHDTPSPAPLQK